MLERVCYPISHIWLFVYLCLYYNIKHSCKTKTVTHPKLKISFNPKVCQNTLPSSSLATYTTRPEDSVVP